MQYTDTHLMVADVHTKGFTDEKKWIHAQTMVGVMDPSALEARQAKYFGLKEKIPKEDAAPKEECPTLK